MVYSGHGDTTEDLIRPEDGRRERGICRVGPSRGQDPGEAADQSPAIGDRPEGRPGPVGGEPMIPGAIYARKSTEQNGVADEEKSVARQIERARAYAAGKGVV